MTVTEGNNLWGVLEERFDLNKVLEDGDYTLIRLRFKPPEERDPDRVVARYELHLEHPIYAVSKGNMGLTPPGRDEITESRYGGRISRYEDGRWSVTDDSYSGGFFGSTAVP